MTDDLTKNITIADLMTKNVISVTPDSPVIKAVDIMLQKGFNGMPVLNHAGELVGIITEYDLVIKGSSIHLPTFLRLFQEFKVYSKDRGAIKQDIGKIIKMKVGDVMNPEPLMLLDSDSLDTAVQTFSDHHKVNPILIVDDKKKLVGVLSRYDLIKLLGASSIDFAPIGDERQLDKNINLFLKDFERRFLFVSKMRTHTWFYFSVIFAIVGFIIAFAIILRIR